MAKMEGHGYAFLTIGAFLIPRRSGRERIYMLWKWMGKCIGGLWRVAKIIGIALGVGR